MLKFNRQILKKNKVPNMSDSAMINYRDKKAHARSIAIEWQLNFNNWPRYWSYCAEWSARWERIGRKYGLMREFKENGIL